MTAALVPRFDLRGARINVPPSACVYVATAGSWVFAAASSATTRGMAGHHGGRGTLAEFLMFAAMTLAMMLPVAAPAASYVGHTALWRRRHELPLFYAAGFAGVWALFALVAWDVQQDLGVPGTGGWWVPATAVVVAAWPFTSWRWAADRRCPAVIRVPAFGRDASKRACIAGAGHGRRCVGSCGPAMLLMLVGPRLFVVVAIVAIQFCERRRGSNPFAYRRARVSAVGYLALATAAALAALAS